MSKITRKIIQLSADSGNVQADGLVRVGKQLVEQAGDSAVVAHAQLPGVQNLGQGIGDTAFGKIAQRCFGYRLKKVDAAGFGQPFVAVGNAADDRFAVGGVIRLNQFRKVDEDLAELPGNFVFFAQPGVVGFYFTGFFTAFFKPDFQVRDFFPDDGGVFLYFEKRFV